MKRLQADFENYKKRTAKENEIIRENASADLALKLLSVVDEFQIALEHMQNAEQKEIRKGIELIYIKLLDILKREGVEPMKSLDGKFDPYKHDAIRHVGGKEGMVVEEIQKGYTIKGKILRHAKVAVGNGQESLDKNSK